MTLRNDAAAAKLNPFWHEWSFMDFIMGGGCPSSCWFTVEHWAPSLWVMPDGGQSSVHSLSAFFLFFNLQLMMVMWPALVTRRQNVRLGGLWEVTRSFIEIDVSTFHSSCVEKKAIWVSSLFDVNSVLEERFHLVTFRESCLNFSSFWGPNVTNLLEGVA